MRVWVRITIAATISIIIGLLVVFILHPFKPCPGITFFVIGDWGRDGNCNQQELGKYMGEIAEKLRPEFVISTGDNFYQGGLVSDNDDQFYTSFQQIYNSPALNVPWYVVLGNHDYNTTGECLNAFHQLGLSYKKQDARWNCQRTFERSYAGGRIHLFFIDSTPYLEMFRNLGLGWNDSECEPTVNDACWKCQLDETEYKLHVSSADWKIVVGHHTMYSNGFHKNTTELVQNLDPILKQNKVQLYLNGHDHNLEHIHFEGESTHYVTSGAGSSTRNLNDTIGSWFQWNRPGFVVVTIYPEVMQLDYYGLGRGLLFTIQISKDGKIRRARLEIPSRYAVQDVVEECY